MTLLIGCGMSENDVRGLFRVDSYQEHELIGWILVGLEWKGSRRDPLKLKRARDRIAKEEPQVDRHSKGWRREDSKGTKLCEVLWKCLL